MAAKKGDKVSVHYRGTLEDGTEFDSSYERAPLDFTIGDGMLIPGFEQAVIGKEQGDKVEVVIAPADAYGEYNEEMVAVLPISEVPEHINPEVGMMLQISVEGGDMDVVITRLDENEIELDGNHPLAGKTLKFEIEVVAIQ